MIGAKEAEIRCLWKVVDRQIVSSAECARIQLLTTEYLQKLARDSTGWETLYQDPTDRRLWELTYPHGEMHGGGPPLLRVISEEEARRKYTF